jgi:hypothetical protein
LIIAAESPPTRADRVIRIAAFAVWAVAVTYLASVHVFWRDEVRAFTLALRGDTVFDMLRAIHGEGHPALWYLLLRGAHAIAPLRAVLPAVAWTVAVGAMTLLVFRSPLRATVVVLILFGEMGLREYAVSARNYGIAMLVLFAIAWAYPRHRDRGLMLGFLLALLCNTNVPAALLAAALLLFWLIELIGEEGLRWTARYRHFLLNAGLAAIGAALCFVEVFPTVNDAAVTPHPGGIGPAAVLAAIVSLGNSFPAFAPRVMGWTPLVSALFSILLVGSVVGLAKRPAAFLSSLAVLLSFELFFQLVYIGSYRHQALFLVYLIVMYWLAALGHGGRWPASWRIQRPLAMAARAGTALFVMLLALQVPNGLGYAGAEASGVPASRSRDFARLLERERLLDATLIADPDVFLEPMPYYVPNPIYLLREQRYGDVVRFTRNARLHLTLDDILSAALMIHARTGKPVVIVLQRHLDPRAPPALFEDGYGATFSTDGDQIARFLAATRLLARFPPAISDESYDVYRLR